MVLRGESGFIEIHIQGRTHPSAINKDDLGWLNAEIKIEVSGFKAHYKANLHFADLQQFYNQLINLDNQSSVKAEFYAIEDDLDLELTVGKRGEVLCVGLARHEGNSLKFEIETDLSTLNSFSKDLHLILNNLSMVH